MGFASGLALKSLQWILRAIDFACAGIVLAIFSYFLAKVNDQHDMTIRVVEGISALAALYLVLGLLLGFCLGGIAFFSFIAIVLDILFAGAFIYVAFENRHAANSCSGHVTTFLGSGPASSKGHGVKLRTACKLETAVFAISIVAVFFFFLSAFVEFGLARHHQREKAFGPGPGNNYTQGSAPRRMRFPWQRRRKDQLAAGALHPDALPPHQTPADMTTVRKSHQTDVSAVNGNEPGAPGFEKYENGGVGGGHSNVGTARVLHHDGSVPGSNSMSGAHGATPYPNDGPDAYDRYGHSAGYQIPDASERTEMPSEIPVSQHARNY